MAVDREWRARLAAFQWLADLGAPESELTRTTLARGFELDGIRIPLVGPQGIWSPAGFEVPLSITTIPGQYPDRHEAGTDLLRYSYRLPNAQHRDNFGLRLALRRNVPLVYFFRTDPGFYLATFPVYIVGDDRRTSMFSVQVDEAWAVTRDEPKEPDVAEAPLRRAYATRVVRQRLFQAEFRRRVVDAYRTRCALCRLRHRELLDAAHIIPDAAASGEPLVSNGMALCKLHHAAFDQFFFTVTPDYRVEVRPSILVEKDGPMLIVGLQEIHGQRIELPARRDQLPDPERLARRYDQFRQAS